MIHGAGILRVRSTRTTKPRISRPAAISPTASADDAGRTFANDGALDATEPSAGKPDSSTERPRAVAASLLVRAPGGRGRRRPSARPAPGTRRAAPTRAPGGPARRHRRDRT